VNAVALACDERLRDPRARESLDGPNGNHGEGHEAECLRRQKSRESYRADNPEDLDSHLTGANPDAGAQYPHTDRSAVGEDEITDLPDELHRHHVRFDGIPEVAASAQY
jgi:hypothetical protein